MAIGFIGIGKMGLPMAEHLLGMGEEFIIHDIYEAALAPLTARQARPAANPREVADRAEITFVSLPTLDILREVVLGRDGAVHGTAMKLLVNTCTVCRCASDRRAGQGARSQRHRPSRLPDQRRSLPRARRNALRHGLG
ncbi:MAG: NAD(P)-binding domain-containing protein [Deltaproteobacteria bacterium]|nr:NAD(P)-binding domain-containing protein [Deltaproteobacteria bacterium]